MALHLTAVLLFQQHTGSIIHVPGKLVPLVIKFLEPHVDPDKYSLVTRFQQLVTVRWKASAGGKPSSQETAEDVAEGSCDQTESSESSAVALVNTDQEFKNLMEELKRLVIKPRKSAADNN